MGAIASQITSLTMVYSTVYSDPDQNLRATGLCAGNSPGTGEFPAQMASNAEKCFHLMTSSCKMHRLFSLAKTLIVHGLKTGHAVQCTFDVLPSRFIKKANQTPMVCP